MKKIIVLLLSFVAVSSFAASRAQVAWDKIAQGALLVDVRTPQEFHQQHLPNAINYPLNTVPSEFANIDKNREIVVYCRSGNRSGQAQRYLQKVGFTRVHNGGGIQELLSSK